jgi:hypothetical protein
MELTDYLINVVKIEEPELLLEEPAFTFSLVNFEEDNDE